MAEFVKVAKKADIPEDTGHLVQVNGKDIALYKSGNEICAIYAICPHQGGPLNEGGLNDGKAICPWHGWEFDLKTGACTFNESIKVPVFNVKQEGDDIYVEA